MGDPTSQVSALLRSLPVDEGTAAELVSRVRRRFDERAAEAAAPVDSALNGRVDVLEQRLVGLTQELQQRRHTIPGFVAQRLDERNRETVATAVALTAQDAASETTNALAAPPLTDFQGCVAASARADEAARAVHRVLDQATELSSHIGAASTSAAYPSVTDKAITHVEDGKENSSAASVLRRRLASTAEQRQLRAAALPQCLT